MTPQKLLTWLGEFAKANPTFVASVSILTLGGIPLLFYAIHIDQLPDFSLTDLTGALIATFITEVFVGVLLALYLLSAGFAARWCVHSFYPLATQWSPADPVKAVEQIEQTGTVDYLMKGRFIVGATVICSIIWSAFIVTLVLDWHRGTGLTLLNWGAYLISLGCAVALTMTDWRNVKSTSQSSPLLWPKITLGCLMLLAWGVWLAWRIYAPGAAPPLAATTAGATTAASSTVAASATATASSTATASATVAASAAASSPPGDGWLSVVMHLVEPYALLYCAVAIVVIVAAVFILTRWFKEIKALLQGLVSSEKVRLRTAKVAVTIVFGLAMILPILFLWLIVASGKADHQTFAAGAGGFLLAILNWLSFSAHRVMARLIAMLATLFICLFSVPLLMQNPTFYPQMIVRVLGFGNVHASSVTLSSQQCATLRAYGVDCEAKKDESIAVTNVNILNRLGNSVLMELMVYDALTCDLETSAERQLPSSDEHGEIRLRELTLCHGVPQQQRPDTGCDSLLMERLRYPTQLDPKHVTCVHLSVPKDQLVGFTPDGGRTYINGYSHYVDAVKRPAPKSAKSVQKPKKPESHLHSRPCDCLTRAPAPTPAS